MGAEVKHTLSKASALDQEIIEQFRNEATRNYAFNLLVREYQKRLYWHIRKIIIDLSAVTHIDSTGIGRCIAGLNKCMVAGARLHMAGAKGQVREAFRVTRLDRMFKFFDQVPDAQAAIGA